MASEQDEARDRRTADPGLAIAYVLFWSAAGLGASWIGIWPALGGAAVVLGGWALLADASEVRSRLAPGQRPLARGLALGLATSAVTVAATYLLYPVVVAAAPWLAVQAGALYDAFRAPSALVVALALVPIIVGEEVVWRGAVHGAIARRTGPWRTAVLTGALYALANAAVGSTLLVVISFGLGLAWSLVRGWSGGLVAPIVAHLTWNLVVLLWLPLDRM